MRLLKDFQLLFGFACLMLSYSLEAHIPVQQRVLKIAVDGDTANPISIPSYDEGELTYACLDDLASALGLGTYRNEEARKLEVRLKGYRLKATAESPFIVITDVATNAASVHQLPNAVEIRDRKLYVPSTSFFPLFRNLFDRQISLLLPAKDASVESVTRPGAFDITGLSVEPKLNGYVVRISANKHLEEYECWQKDDRWLYITIANARVDVERMNMARPTEIFSKVVAIQYPASAQLTLKLTQNVASSEITADPASHDLLVSLRVMTRADSIAAEAERRELLAALKGTRERWKLDVIVIDAGHGGEDPGAIGVTRVKEKDVTLGIALKLGRLIERNLKDVKVVYTRKTDTFVELDRRGQIANAAGGKLFISIHCNSMPRKPHTQNGFEVYLLRPGRTEDAIRIAERENAVIKLEKGYEKRYQQLTEENFILVAMAQSAYVKYSERFAEILQIEMARRLPLGNSGVKQAGFLVLTGASMPNVLVETAYLSNRKDEAFLKSRNGQEAIAEAIFSAVKRYKAEYEKTLDEGREIGGSN